MSTPAAGLRAVVGDDAYFSYSRPELRALVPRTAYRVLDVGCGDGSVGAALREERGCEVVGLEGVASVVATARSRLDAAHLVDLDEVETLPYPPGWFDAIVCGDVLEHLRDPEGLLRVLLRWLAPGGSLVCSIPNVKHWSVLLPLLVEDRFPYADAGLLDRTHVHLFTLTEVDVLFTRLGLEVTQLETTVHGPLPPELRPLLEVVGLLGGEPAETAERLNAYQYLVVARRAADA